MAFCTPHIWKCTQLFGSLSRGKVGVVPCKRTNENPALEVLKLVLQHEGRKLISKELVRITQRVVWALGPLIEEK